MVTSQVRTVMIAVAMKALPIVPGDILRFTATKNSMFIVAVTEQEHISGSACQRICGFLADHAKCTTSWQDIWLDWSGYNELWTIERILL